MLTKYVKGSEPGTIDKTKLYKVLADYEDHLEKAEGHLKITGKTLAQVNKEHASWQYYFSARKVEIKILYEYVEQCLEHLRGKLYVKYNEKHNKSLTHQQIDRYIDKDDDYLEMFEILLAVRESRDNFQAVVEAFQSRGYNIKNLTELHIHAIQNDII